MLKYKGNLKDFPYFFMTRIVILAAGNGTRMNASLPKVLVPLKGRPMIQYLLDSIKLSGLDPRPLIIVSPNNEALIRRELSEYDLDYVLQDKQLGTGHAVSCARDFLGGEAKNVLVLYGDHPFFTAASLKKISSLEPAPLAILTTQLPDFNDWRHNFYHWGRIIRAADNQIVKIVEFKDASDEEKLISEVNPAVMCFNRDWLLKHLPTLQNNNRSGEYYLTDLVQIAFDEGRLVASIGVAPYEAMGINSLTELKISENLVDTGL